MRYRILSMLVSNQFGVLTRVTGLFSRRGFNIKELTVGETVDPAVSRITVLTEGGDEILEQIQKQLIKLEDVKKVVEITEEEAVSQELLLIKISLTADTLASAAGVLEEAGAQVLHTDDESLIAQITADTRSVDAFIQKIKPYGILESCRTGITALSTGRKTIYDV